jgi:acyl carrier protein
MTQKLIDLVAGVLNVSNAQLSPESGPKSVEAWDSLAHVTIVSAVEQTYGVQLTMPEILAIGSVADLRRTLEGQGVAFTRPDAGDST